jgi:transketolase
MRNTAANLVYEYCKENKDGYLIAGDAGYGVWDTFQEELSEQYINPGINEAACIGLAAGMALSGHKVFYYNIIPFVLMRCYEQVRLDICYQELPVVLIGIGSGITYAPAGMTHYSVEDITIAKSMPNLNIISPSDPMQTKKAVEYAIKSNKPTYIRIARSGEPTLFDEDIDITKPTYLQKGSTKKAIVFHGSIIDEVVEASNELKNISIISLAMIAPLDEEEMKSILVQYETIYIIEEHFEEGGLGTILSDFSMVHNIDVNIVKIGIRNHYIHEIGNCHFLREKFGIDAKSIVNKVQ